MDCSSFHSDPTDFYQSGPSKTKTRINESQLFSTSTTKTCNFTRTFIQKYSLTHSALLYFMKDELLPESLLLRLCSSMFRFTSSNSSFVRPEFLTFCFSSTFIGFTQNLAAWNLRRLWNQSCRRFARSLYWAISFSLVCIRSPSLVFSSISVLSSLLGPPFAMLRRYFNLKDFTECMSRLNKNLEFEKWNFRHVKSFAERAPGYTDDDACRLQHYEMSQRARCGSSSPSKSS